MSVVRIVIFIAGIGLAFFSYHYAADSSSSNDRSPLDEASMAKLQTLLTADLQNPVIDQNFPDPGFLEVDGAVYGFATNSRGRHIQAARSDDLLTWSMLSDAMPELAPWVQPRPNMIWAPEAIKIGDDFRLYYTAHDRASDRQCIGVAISKDPGGPYRDDATRPLLCPPGYQRAIDPSPFALSGQVYLYFSGVCCDTPNGIYAQRLTPDGLSTVGAPVLIVKVDSPWEGTIAEAPSMIKVGSKYYLFYSGNDYRNQTYATGYATCKSPAGPCTKARENPILATGSSGSRVAGPGHQFVLKFAGEYWILFHGWNGPIGDEQGGRRALWLQPLEWQAGKPTVGIRAAIRN